MKLLASLLMFISMPALADLVSPPAHGFHWYSTEAKEPRMKPVQPTKRIKA